MAEDTIRVRAIERGFFGDQLRQVGQEFVLRTYTVRDPKTKKPRVITAEQQFSAAWMERVDGTPKTPAPTSPIVDTIDEPGEPAGKPARRSRQVI